MNTIHIPKTMQEMENHLNGVERLLTAKKWERAAIVAAFVRLGEHGVSPAKATTSLSTHEFAALGIAGLKSKDTVRNYVQRWLDTHDGIYPDTGADVLLPDDSEWESLPRGTNGTNSVVGASERLREMAKSLTSDELAEVIREAAPQAADAVAASVLYDPPAKQPKPKPVPGGDDATSARMDTMAVISTALGHATAVKLRLDARPDTFVADVDAVKLRRLSEAWSMLADLIEGVDADGLSRLLSEVDG